MNTFSMYSGETRNLSVDFSGKLAPTETVSTVSVSVTGLTVTATPNESNEEEAVLVLSGGSAGQSYEAVVTATTSESQTLVAKLLIFVD